jgi:hypothetical protein
MAYISSRHFVEGHPAPHKPKDNIDWIPILNLGYRAKQEQEEQLGRIRKERRRKVEINWYFSFLILLNIHLLF